MTQYGVLVPNILLRILHLHPSYMSRSYNILEHNFTVKGRGMINTVIYSLLSRHLQVMFRDVHGAPSLPTARQSVLGHNHLLLLLVFSHQQKIFVGWSQDYPRGFEWFDAKGSEQKVGIVV